MSEFDFDFVVFVEEPFTYQEIAQKAYELYKLQMSFCQIGEALQVNDKTAAKAVRYAESLARQLEKQFVS